MALRIVEEERQEYKVDGSTIYYTHVGWGELRDIRNASVDGKMRVDEGAVEEALLDKHVHGWDQVLDREGKPVPFSLKALLRLPPFIVDTLVARICTAYREEEKAQGESRSSSTT